MRILQVRILRAVLIGLIIVVSLAVLANYLQTRHNRGEIAKPAAQILSPDLLRSVESPEYSAYENGIQKFRVRAKKLLDTRQGKRLLQGIVANDFNPDGSVRTEITSETAEYDQARKEVLFSGDVRLHPGKNVEVRMESLRYNINDQKGSSDGPMRLISPHAEGSGKGVRYDNARRLLELQSDLSFVLHRLVLGQEGAQGVEDYHLAAQRGLYSEQELLIRLLGNARVLSSTGVLSGDRVDATFTADKRRLTSLSSRGHAVYESTDHNEVRTLHGDRLDFTIDSGSLALESIHAEGQAGFALKSPEGDQDLSAKKLQVTLDPVKGLPRMIQSQQDVRFEFRRGTQKTEVAGEWLEAVFLQGGNALESMEVREHADMKISAGATGMDELQAEYIRISFTNLEGRSVPRDVQAEKNVQWKSPGQGAAEPGRSLTASSLSMRYSQTGESLEFGNASGGVTLEALPKPGVAGTELRRLQCDRTDFSFYPGSNRLRLLTGDGHVQVRYRSEAAGAKGQPEEFQTSSTTIRAQFREADSGVEEITQAGGFVYQDGTRIATSGTCDFSAATEKLVLRDHPSVNETDYSASGEEIEHDRKGKVLTIRRNVRSVLKSASGKDQGFMTGTADTSSPTVITSDEMLYWKDEDKAQYTGHVHLLSAMSQLEAHSLLVLSKGERVDAEGEVKHLILKFGDLSQGNRAKETQLYPAKKDDKAKVSGPVLIRSDQLQYVRAKNTIHYTHNVSLDSADAKIWAEAMDVFLDSEGRKVERAKATGDLRITQPGREVKGQEGEYFLAEGKFVVTGQPAVLVDSVKGSSSARQLTFYTADDRIQWVR